MTPFTRRDALRLGGVAGATALGAAALGGDLSVAGAARAEELKKRVRARLDKVTYRRGERMTLTVRDNLPRGRRISVRDSSGRTWTRRPDSGKHRIYTARADETGRGTVTVAAMWDDGRVVHNRRYRYQVHYEISGQQVNGFGSGALIGMNAPADEWDLRVREVGAGLAARRIFADLSAGANSQLDLVERAHADGMLPVISYKVGGDAAGAASGRFDAAAEQAATKLASYGLPTAVTVWHEPYPDISGAQYAALSRRLLPIFRRGEVKVGPILNGWLLDRQTTTFASYAPDDLFRTWDWFGIDTYETGTATNPSAFKPADAIRKMSAFVTSRGFDLPLGVGEYNGQSGATILAAGDALFTTPNVWFGCLWNQNLDFATVLTGDRLSAFRQTLADPRRRDLRIA
ncbi:hypothetical protein G5V58_17885 [Nocardioides anomalus]|uniref:GH26 domain-containing protein n=1 Tax=Nocardioides anomalus TaxID=2712223 RepID=A0A6G6WGR1_9ACTN|nr:hypothetical protein [Nocardioides anomalus]QIG44399.1 hypothetical protein G5V58_17885 [Nocardioides anomalus]